MYYAARYDLVMFARRELNGFGDPVDGSLPVGKTLVSLGQGYTNPVQAQEAVDAGNKSCKDGEQLSCTFKNGEQYNGPRYHYELVSEER